MGDKSEIQWTDATWNPVTGCSKVSPGCAHCYAESLTARYAGQPGWIEEYRPWTPANAEHNVRLRPERLDQPLRWKRPRMVFVNSMSDLFHERVPDEYIANVFAVMQAAQQHVFQVLTKRPERMQALLSSDHFGQLRADAVDELASDPTSKTRGLIYSGIYYRVDPHAPLPNVWLGTSIENRRYVGRADVLRETPAAVRFISAEPLLGPLLPPHWIADETDDDRDGYCSWSDDHDGPGLDLTGIDWLIVGGESGPHARRCELGWVRDLRDACHASRHSYSPLEDAQRADLWTGTQFFFKQWGGRTPKAGGRELDGRTWDEMPVALEPAA